MMKLLLLLVFFGASGTFASDYYSTQRSPCLLDKDPGPCKAAIRRYFFNRRTGQCEQFTYGGCFGNANNFVSKFSCIKTCKNLQCKLLPGTGPCRARILAYFFNSTSHRCETFIYGGCQGNANRFGTADECAASCCAEPDHCHPDCSTVSCARPDCAPGVDTEVPLGECCPVCVCKVGNQTLFPGDTFQPDCNTCTCTDTGLAFCTLIACSADPCKDFKCPSGSTCEVFQPTGEAFCQPSCDLDNGGCASNETCLLEEVQCVRAPCPPVVKCLPKRCPIEGQVFTTCGTACPPTCSEPGPVVCTAQCVVGCQCPVGTVLDEMQSKCVTLDQCQCPPTCSHQFCSSHGNKYKPCSRPPPFTVPPCPDKCRTTFCHACYYSDTAQPTPPHCGDICEFPPSTRCLYYWSRCVYYHGVHTTLDYYSKTTSNFRCYEYNCPLRG